ncbi:hypothetical protein LCGC14_2850470 [marine sediment metagenome]|uniref:Uncharacterized protein n=1 Tax=marine sediment metagenome TaxID=412755 RepID=A0A0F8Y8P7_9ZZZZ
MLRDSGEIYNYQTKDEKIFDKTGNWNDVGFNKPDDRAMSYYAGLVLGGKELYML